MRELLLDLHSAGAAPRVVVGEEPNSLVLGQEDLAHQVPALARPVLTLDGLDAGRDDRELRLEPPRSVAQLEEDRELNVSRVLGRVLEEACSEVPFPGTRGDVELRLFRRHNGDP